MDISKLIHKSNPIIFDIGCNDGAHTAMFLNLFPRATVYAFEPDPRAITNFKQKNLNAILFEGVVSDIEGVVEFHQCNIDTGWDKSGSILKPKVLLESHNWLTWGNDIWVASTTLDSFTKLNNIGYIDFIWADVQGVEEKMILGGLNTFSRTGYLFTEYSVGELYETATSKERILELLPDFELIELLNTNEYGGDMLLKNKGD